MLFRLGEHSFHVVLKPRWAGAEFSTCFSDCWIARHQREFSCHSLLKPWGGEECPCHWAKGTPFSLSCWWAAHIILSSDIQTCYPDIWAFCCLHKYRVCDAFGRRQSSQEFRTQGCSWVWILKRVRRDPWHSWDILHSSNLQLISIPEASRRSGLLCRLAWSEVFQSRFQAQSSRSVLQAQPLSRRASTSLVN